VFNVIFPEAVGQRYYDVHFQYMLNMLKEIRCPIKYEKRDGFTVTINRKTFLMDFADTPDVVSSSLPIFKFHCHEETDGVFAFPPISFHNWKQYNLLLSWVKYTANGFISYRQRAYGNAKVRRQTLKRLLKKHFTNLQTEPVSRLKYLQEVSDTFLAVFVPGWSNNMLDRAQFQYMALGCCTISPRLPELLPFGKSLVPDEHYVLCKDDYSDIVDLIRFYEEHKEICMRIGTRAQELFQETATPRRVGEWIKTKL